MLASRGGSGDGIHKPLTIDRKWVAGTLPTHRNPVARALLCVGYVLAFALRLVVFGVSYLVSGMVWLAGAVGFVLGVVARVILYPFAKGFQELDPANGGTDKAHAARLPFSPFVP